jgi:transposase
MFQAHPDLRVYQQDNAWTHTARIPMDFLNSANIRVMPWPALSPDLASIEHAWDEFGRRVYSRANKPTTVDGLRRALTEEWNNSHKQLFKTLSCQCVVVALHASMLEVDIPGTDFSI